MYLVFNFLRYDENAHSNYFYKEFQGIMNIDEILVVSFHCLTLLSSIQYAHVSVENR